MNEASGSMMSQWCLQEFDRVDLGDERLNRRFLQTASQLATLPQASISQACQTRAAIKGAYRLFSHEKLDRNEILELHVQKTLERIRGHARVLVIQDTTVLEFGTHRKTRGLGPVAGKMGEAKNCRGLIAHSSLVVTPEGLSLGLLDQKIWARDNPEFDHVIGGERESFKWLESLERASTLLPEGVEAITLADREADITELLQWASRQEMPFVIRARDRTLQGSEHQWLRRHLEHEPSVASYEVEVPIRASTRSQRKLGVRTAHLDVRFGAVNIRTDRKGGCLPLYAVLVHEKHPPEGSEGVSWILLTNVEVKSATDAKERILWYQKRWHIENFHRVLKSGCTIEQTRLQEAERLDRYITLMSVIAWRLYWLTHVARVYPDESCEQVLDPIEWKILHLQIRPGEGIPKTPPTLRQAAHWIGRLGGFLGTKKYPDPGVTTLWRGYQRLYDITTGFQLKQHAAICGE